MNFIKYFSGSSLFGSNEGLAVNYTIESTINIIITIIVIAI